MSLCLFSEYVWGSNNRVSKKVKALWLMRDAKGNRGSLLQRRPTNQRLNNAPITQGTERAGKRLHDERGAIARTLSAGGCTTGTDINDSGLWIFTRQQTRNDTHMERVREIASAKGLNLAVMDAVQQPLSRDATEIVELTTVVRQIDWRAVSRLGHREDQGQCSSCLTFSTTKRV